MKRCLYLLLLFVITSCNKKFYTVTPNLETSPVSSSDDAADDPAIFIHPTDLSKQAIIGTNKQQGLVVYDNKGKIIKEYPVGRVNNVDLRQDIPWNGEKITIVGASNRTNNGLVFFRMNEENLELEPMHKEDILSKVDEVYGFCMYLSDKPYAFVVGKDGVVEQWRLSSQPDGSLQAEMLRTFDVGEQCEGMVADDEFKHLYIGEEEVGIWKYGAEPNQGQERTKIDLISDNNRLKADIEGLTIYYMANGDGYLFASSQGNNSYAIYERKGQNQYLGSFKIRASENIGGTSDTDGIDVTSRPFGPYQKGVFIAQDGFNGKENQNFKVVDYRLIEEFLEQLQSN